MPIRMIAVDLDGTLLNSRSTISPSNLSALTEARRRGVELVVVTGRRFESAVKVLAPIPWPVTLISSNGAMVRTTGGEILHRDFLPLSVAQTVLETAFEYRPYAVAIFDVSGRGQIVMEHSAVSEGPLGWYLVHSPDHLLQVPDLLASLTSDPIQLMFGGPPERVGPIEVLLRERFQPLGFHLTWTKYLSRNLSILDVMNLGCTKGQALARWAALKEISPAEVMAFGDNLNDLEMLEFAGTPVVMGNCAQGLARDGWTVTQTNDQDGVAMALESLVLSPVHAPKPS
jgi:Cof subfamily protein (haloacid dehalogenase superfamily)